MKYQIFLRDWNEVYINTLKVNQPFSESIEIMSHAWKLIFSVFIFGLMFYN